VHVSYTIEQDEYGAWCAHAQLCPGVGAGCEEDRREALSGLIAEFGALDELDLMLDAA
jgi:hypothetical protein